MPKPVPVKIGNKFFSVRAGSCYLIKPLKYLANGDKLDGVIKDLEIITDKYPVILFGNNVTDLVNDLEKIIEKYNLTNKTAHVSTTVIGPDASDTPNFEITGPIAITPDGPKESKPETPTPALVETQPEPESTIIPYIAEEGEDPDSDLQYLTIGDEFNYRGQWWEIIRIETDSIITKLHNYLTEKAWSRKFLFDNGICVDSAEFANQPVREEQSDITKYEIVTPGGDVIQTFELDTSQPFESEEEPVIQTQAQPIEQKSNNIQIGLQYERDWTWIKIVGHLNEAQRLGLYKHNIRWHRKRQRYYAKEHIQPEFVSNILNIQQEA
jgi:hypothetical protein